MVLHQNRIFRYAPFLGLQNIETGIESQLVPFIIYFGREEGMAGMMLREVDSSPPPPLAGQPQYASKPLRRVLCKGCHQLMTGVPLSRAVGDPKGDQYHSQVDSTRCYQRFLAVTGGR